MTMGVNVNFNFLHFWVLLAFAIPNSIADSRSGSHGEEDRSVAIASIEQQQQLWSSDQNSHHRNPNKVAMIRTTTADQIRQKWPEFEQDVQLIDHWVGKSKEHADELLKVLLYLSSLDQPIYIEMDLLNLVDKRHILLKQIEKMCKKPVEQFGDQNVSFMLGHTGVMPVYVDKAIGHTEEVLAEQIEVGKLIAQIAQSAKNHQHGKTRLLFHEVLSRVAADLKNKKWSNGGMKKRIVSWQAGVQKSLQHLSMKKVAKGLKDVALWLINPEHVVQMIQLILYFTNVSAAVKIPLEIFSALGMDEVFTRMSTKMGVNLLEKGANQKLVMWMFGPNGLAPVFVRQGEQVDPQEVMDSINLASVWYYYHKYQRGGYDHIRCKQKIWVDGIGHHCKWSIDKYFDVDKEKIEEKMQQHLEEVHPIKYEEQLAAQLQKEDIIRRADFLYYFDKDKEHVKCKLMLTNEDGKSAKCDWVIELGKASEEALNDHLSLEHLTEFEQRLKAKREKDLPVRRLHVPLENSLNFFQQINASLAMNKGKPIHHLVDIVFDHLRRWKRQRVAEWKLRWKRIKQIRFKDVCEKFKHAAMWLISPKHINNVLNIIFAITKLDGPIYLTLAMMKAFGLTKYIVDKLDEGSQKARRDYEGTPQEKMLLFMIGENGVIRLFLDLGSHSITGTSEEQRKLSKSGTVEFLNTCIWTVVENPGLVFGALVMKVMQKVHDLRLELSLSRKWNQKWPELKQKYNIIKNNLEMERIALIAEDINVEDWMESRASRQNTQQTHESMQISKETISIEIESGDASRSSSIVPVSTEISGTCPSLTKSASSRSGFNKPDCPDPLLLAEEPVPETSDKATSLFANLLNLAVRDNCQTMLMRRNKIQVEENFVDQVVKAIMRAESEASVPPLINIRFENAIHAEKQPILKKLGSLSMLFLYQMMSRAGIQFDDCADSRPIELSFQGPKHKNYILLLPNCAKTSGKFSEFAIFRADYFDSKPLEEAEEGRDEVDISAEISFSSRSKSMRGIRNFLKTKKRTKTDDRAEMFAVPKNPSSTNIDHHHHHHHMQVDGKHKDKNSSSAASAELPPAGAKRMRVDSAGGGSGHHNKHWHVFGHLIHHWSHHNKKSGSRETASSAGSKEAVHQQQQLKFMDSENRMSKKRMRSEPEKSGRYHHPPPPPSAAEDCPGKLESENNGPVQFGYILTRAVYLKCAKVQILHQKFEMEDNFVDKAVEAIMNWPYDQGFPPVINIRLPSPIRLDKQLVAKKLAMISDKYAQKMLISHPEIGGVECDQQHQNPLGNPMGYVFMSAQQKEYLLLIPPACAKDDGGHQIRHFFIYQMDLLLK